MNHFLYGASIPFVIGVLLYLLRKRRAPLSLLILIPLAMAFAGTWAVVPDIPRMLGYQDLYSRLAADPGINIFLWHYTLDQIETESSWYAVGIALEAATLMGMALRELFREAKS
jgi:hypothetical protein